jgi:hypothetical protein
MAKDVEVVLVVSKNTLVTIVVRVHDYLPLDMHGRSRTPSPLRCDYILGT